MCRIPNISLFFLFVFSISAYALPRDTAEKIHIFADSSLVNYKTGETTYEGNVKIDQGTTHLTADKVVIQLNAHRKIESAVAYGTTHLAKYTTLPKLKDTIMNAEAKVIKYFPPKTLVQLEGDVVITQGENSFHGPLIIYNMKEEIISAPASKLGRATIVIEPNKLKS